MLDWDDLRSFLAIARAGNLSAAARALKVTQTTMGRRLDALHERVGVRLLQKTPRGYILTPAGERILAGIERMEAEALAVERSVTGEDSRIAGQVRITTVETFGARVLIPILQPLLAQQPELDIELITDTRALSLSRREADVALRLAPFEQHETVVRHVADMAFSIYASTDYLMQRGPLDRDLGGGGHAIVTLQEDLALLPEAKLLKQVAPSAHAVLRTNSRDAQLQAVIGGYGIGCLPCYLAQDHKGLVEIGTPAERFRRGIWFGIHRDMRHVPRIRLVADAITEGLRRSADLLDREHAMTA